MSGIQQNFAYGRSFGFPYDWPANIGDAYGGGFFAGQINVSGTKYNLIVASKASGESSGLAWGTVGVSTGTTSVINGPANTTSLAALGAAYQAAVFCNNLNSGGGLNGYTDWYMPAKNELEVLYYFLKPTTSANSTSHGANANAVSPEPISTNYTSGSPVQTSATDFQYGGAEAFNDYIYWSSTENDINNAWRQSVVNGFQTVTTKSTTDFYVRAVRRVPV